LFLAPVDYTAWHMVMTKTERDKDFAAGYHPVVTIAYDQAAVDAVLTEETTEQMLTVRRWNPRGGFWDGYGISGVTVDTEANTISFSIDNLTKASAYGPETNSHGNIFQVFVPKSSAPIYVYSFTPRSEYVANYTDADPTIKAYLNDITGMGINTSSVCVKIDDMLVADFSMGEGCPWVWGNGSASLVQANAQGTVYELTYSHSTATSDWLTEGEHVLTISYTISGSGELASLDTIFWVDLTPPTMAFHGGWVDNPLLRNIHGYVAGEDEMITVRMTDRGSGILVRELRQDDWYGIRYDLWLVHLEDDQGDIDEFEERVLLHTGTPSELETYIQRQRGEEILDGLAGYNPATDELLVRMPIMGGGMIQDGDILEVVVYSDKHLDDDGPGFGCEDIEIGIGGDTFTISGNCWFDSQSQERWMYIWGIFDQVYNEAAYIEQRFIVDMSSPICTFNLPGATVDPSGPMLIDVSVVDDGAGLASGSVSVVVTDPDGKVVEDIEWTTTETGIKGEIEGPLETGEYVIMVEGADRLGHMCSATKTVRVEAAVLTLTEAYGYPNPYNPTDGEGDMKFHFTLSRASDVTIKVYDFAGEYVTTLASNESKDAGDVEIGWGGTTSEGTKLANGAYIVRVVATDGQRTEQANLKVVIWRD
jgi:hypothetical protein